MTVVGSNYKHMPLIPAFFTCLILWFIFPNAFKYVVGAWLGFCCAMAIYGIVGLLCVYVPASTYNQLFNLNTVTATMVLGIVAGCVIAARG